MSIGTLSVYWGFCVYVGLRCGCASCVLGLYVYVRRTLCVEMLCVYWGSTYVFRDFMYVRMWVFMRVWALCEYGGFMYIGSFCVYMGVYVYIKYVYMHLYVGDLQEYMGF